MYPMKTDASFEEQGDLNDKDFVPKSSEPVLFNQEELDKRLVPIYRII